MLMKNVKMVQVLFILVCLIGYGIASAQSDYVVTAKNDTVRGKVKYLNYTTEKKVQLIASSDNKKSVYSILQTKAFKINNEVYHPIRWGQGYSFMKIMKSGYLSLYSFQQANQVTWNGILLVKKDGATLEMPGLAFKKMMSRFLQECPVVVSKIDSGELGRNEIEIIIDQYNACIESNTKNQKVIQTSVQVSKLEAWEALEKEVNNLSAFEGKESSLEMIAEIKTKIKNEEKVPNFLIEGIKNSLKDQASIKSALEKALQ